METIGIGNKGKQLTRTRHTQMRHLRANGFEFAPTLPTQSAPVLPRGLKEWRANSLPYSMPAGVTDESTPARRELSRLMNLIAKSETGRTLLAAARRARIWVTYDDDQDSNAYFDDLANYIAIKRKVNPDGTFPPRTRMPALGGLVAALSHELRHGWQSTRGDYFKMTRYRPADAALIKRHLEADAEAVAAQIAWELKEQGWDRAWTTDHAWFADMYQSFEREVTRRKASLKDGRAVAAAHQQWFRNRERVDFYDRWTLAWWKIDFDAIGPQLPLKHVKAQSLRKLGALGKGLNYMKHTSFPHPISPPFTLPFTDKAREMADSRNQALRNRIKYRPRTHRPILPPAPLDKRAPVAKPPRP
ncbi:MAG: hypothetical protein Alpg2KO_29630 [Alphaproteobacteria bacterium]